MAEPDGSEFVEPVAPDTMRVRIEIGSQFPLEGDLRAAVEQLARVLAVETGEDVTGYSFDAPSMEDPFKIGCVRVGCIGRCTARQPCNKTVCKTVFTDNDDDFVSPELI